MFVREIMTAPAASVSVDATVEDAISLLARERISCAPVVDCHQRVVGAVSEVDLLHIPMAPDPRGYATTPPVTSPPRWVSDVMTMAPFTTHERADVAQLVNVFVERGWKSIPVVRDSRLVGVVSRSDVIRALSRSDAHLGRDVSRLLADYGDSGWGVVVEGARARVHGPRSAREARLAEAIAASVPGVREVVVEQAAAASNARDRTSPADRRDHGVPDKQLQRWLDDGGAVPLQH